MRAFERTCDPILAKLISDASSRAGIDPRCLARNVEWDSRVGAPRQSDVENLLRKADSTKRQDLSTALTYQKRSLVDGLNSQAFDRAVNGANEIVSGAASRVHPLPEDFGTILNLSWLTYIFQWARANRRGVFSDFPAPTRPSAETDWFDSHLVSRSEPAREAFLEEMFEAIDAYRASQEQKPIWVGDWNLIEEVLRSDSDDWLRFVGCQANPRYPQLVLALKYGVADGMPPLFRPTQLDSGGNHLHFPVPGKTDVELGGFVLNITGLPGPYQASREWVHAPFRWRARFYVAAGRRCEWTRETPVVTAGVLGSSRQQHREYLVRNFGVDPAWMPEVV